MLAVVSVTGGCAPRVDSVKATALYVEESLAPPCIKNPGMIPPVTQKTRELLSEGLTVYDRAELLRQQRDSRGALAVCQEFLDKQQRLLGHDSPYCGTTLDLMANAANEAGDQNRTREIMAELIALKMRYLGPAVTDAARAVEKLELYLISWGLPEEAFRLVDGYMKQADPLHPSLCARTLYLKMLSRAQEAQGHYDEAYSTARKACDLKLSFKPLLAVHPKIYMLLESAARTAIASQRWEEADRALSEATHYRFDAHQMEDPTFLRELLAVAHAWEKSGKNDRAVSALQNALHIAQTSHLVDKDTWINRLQSELTAVSSDRNGSPRRAPF